MYYHGKAVQESKSGKVKKELRLLIRVTCPKKLVQLGFKLSNEV